MTQQTVYNVVRGCSVIVDEKEGPIVDIPSSIFQDRHLAPLESITEYLKDEEGLSYHEIAVLVGRDDRTIWTCYSRAKKKRQENPKPATISKHQIGIPLSIFKDRTFAPLENIATHLKEKVGLSFHEIAVLLNRDDRTVWTSYTRAQKKATPSGVGKGVSAG